MKSAVEWFVKQLNINGVVIPMQIEYLAKEMEEEQRRKDFVNGYQTRAEIAGGVFDEISKQAANMFFKEKTLKKKKNEKN